MAMLGKRFQRTTSMAQIGPSSNLHTEKAQQAAHHPHQHRGQPQEVELANEAQPVSQWEILKNAEAMMMMIMANSGANSTTVESGAEEERQTNKNIEQHAQIGSPSTLIIPTHHFLDACFYCKRRLRPERDIFIYRGDAAFCTEECRHRQILSDESRSARASKKAGGTTSETAVAA